MNIFIITCTLIVYLHKLVSTDEDGESCLMDDEENALVRSGYYPNKYFWPEGRAFYAFHENLTAEADQRLVMEAMWHIENRTCVRFFENSDDNDGYMEMTLSESLEVCGRAKVCYLGTAQHVTVRRSEKCNKMRTWVHEISHGLCLGHEHQRLDRDEFVDFPDCDNVPKIIKLTTRGHLYDYYSRQHYQCFKTCGGTPTQENVKGCGRQINLDGLSVLDADKINDYYDCRGCYGHRWYNAEFITEGHMKHLVNFGNKEGDVDRVYLCRSYDFGSISVGRYNFQDKTCAIYSKFADSVIVISIAKYIQVFGLAHDHEHSSYQTLSDGSIGTTTGYKLINNLEESKRNLLVPVGRDHDNNDIYAAIGEVINTNTGKTETVIGRMDKDLWTKAWVVGSNNDGILIEKFNLLACDNSL